MAISGKKIMPIMGVFMAILMAVLLVVATEGAVTVYNPARINVLVDGESLQVESGVMSIDITQAAQKINITTPTGGIISIVVNDEDIVVLLPEAFVGNAPASVRVVPVPGAFSLAGGGPARSPGENAVQAPPTD